MSVFRDQILAGRVAFVTGGSSGIGLGVAKMLAVQGARVMINGRNAEKLAGAVEEIRALGGTAEGVAADVRNYEAVAAALTQCRAQWGEIDILLCAAAGNFPAILKAAADMKVEHYFVEQDQTAGDPIESVRTSFRNLAKLGF